MPHEKLSQHTRRRIIIIIITVKSTASADFPFSHSLSLSRHPWNVYFSESGNFFPSFPADLFRHFHVREQKLLSIFILCLAQHASLRQQQQKKISGIAIRHIWDIEIFHLAGQTRRTLSLRSVFVNDPFNLQWSVIMMIFLHKHREESFRMLFHALSHHHRYLPFFLACFFTVCIF